MAELLTGIPTNLTEYPNSFKRQGAFPLEAYSIFYNLETAKNYAKNNPIAYVGQIISVISNTDTAIYQIINTQGELQKVGQSSQGGGGQSLQWGSFK